MKILYNIVQLLRGQTNCTILYNVLLYNIFTMVVQRVVKCFYNVFYKFVQCLYNVLLMFLQVLYNFCKKIVQRVVKVL